MSNIRATFSINAAGTVWGAIDGDISNQTDLQDALDLKADKSELETDIEEVNTALSNLSDTVSDNYNTLDDKIDTEISNRVTADEDLQDNIDTLSNTVTNNYTELNNKILDNTANITTNTSSITNINSKIPEQASAVNQLADKNFVNSSIATNTANFIGTFNSIEELEAYSGTLTNNDYAFVATTDSVGNTLYDRYKWNGSEWLFEYELNNSSFTANQWAAINSGITNTLTTQITTNQNAITNIQNNYVPKTRTINGKALNTNITLNASDVNALANTTTINELTTTAQQNALNSGATSAKINQIATNTGNITTNANAISTINDKIPADASSSNRLVTASALSNAVVNLANQDLSNLTETGNDRLHALKGYSDNGELLTDAEGLSDVIKYAHSSFDLSKFTVVGSPVITDDGIASGFSGYSNYVWVNGYNNLLHNADSWKVKGKFTYSSQIENAFPIIATITNAVVFHGFYFTRDNNYFRTRLSSNGTSDNIGTLVVANFTPIDGTEYTVEIEFTGTQYEMAISDNNGNLLGKATPISSTEKINDFAMLCLGRGSTSGTLSIDLKQFSITVDGVEVFSGNKTGLDVIKPDDYTVVGTPTISADGIASGFKQNSKKYIKVADVNSIDFSKPWEIDLLVYTGEIYTIGTYTHWFLSGLSASTRAIHVGFHNSKKIEIMMSNDGTNWLMTSGIQGNYKYQGFTSYYIRIKYDTTKYTIMYSLDGVNYYVDFEINKTTPIYNGGLKLGNNEINGNSYEGGSIDLNAFKIYVDGNLVYQPCLKIPYTESKTGSKIVDSIYRDRVNDMAEQFGYAPYYTLQEDKVGNYSIVGSPTISGDFVASGFSSSNYINTGFKLSDLYNKKWTIKTRTVYKYLNNNGSFGATLLSNYSGSQWLSQGNISINNSTGSILFCGRTIGGAEGTKISITNTETNIKDGDIVDLDLSFDLEKYTLKAVINNSTTITKSWTPTTDDKNLVGTQTSGTIYINSRHGGGGLTNSDCSIDLKQFKIYVDNELTYSAVIDPNFALPQGELYGLIGDKTLRDSYYNGITYWELFSNRRLEQGGTCESGVEYTLPKPFADANYVLTIPYSSKTATSFIPSATGDFIAKGTGLL